MTSLLIGSSSRHPAENVPGTIRCRPGFTMRAAGDVPADALRAPPLGGGRRSSSVGARSALLLLRRHLVREVVRLDRVALTELLRRADGRVLDGLLLRLG